MIDDTYKENINRHINNSKKEQDKILNYKNNKTINKLRRYKWVKKNFQRNMNGSH